MFAIDLDDAQSVVAQTVTGGSLPDWMTFDADNFAFEGTPPPEYVGAVGVRIDVIGNGGTLPTFSIIRDVIIDETFTVGNLTDVEATIENNRIHVNTPEDFNGSVVLNYHATDLKGGVSTTPAIIVVNVLPMPEIPDAGEDNINVVEDGSVTVSLASLLANDVDDDGDDFHAIAINQPARGTLTVNLGTWSFDVAAALGAAVGASFAVTLVDGSPLPGWMVLDQATGLLTATVPLDIKSVFALAMTASLGAETWTGTVSESINGNTNVTVTYVPNPAISGSDSFTYVITDDKQGAGTGTVDIAIAAINDPPVADDDTVQAIEDTVLHIDFATLLQNDTDVDNDVLTILSVLNANHGTVEIVNGEIIFTPDTNFDGEAGFDYVVSDSADGTDTGHVIVDVVSTNQRPVAISDHYDALEDEPVTISIADLLGNDFDPDGDDFSFVSISSDVPGARSFLKPGGQIDIQPDENFNGLVTFTYRITDGRMMGTGQVTVNFAAVNDAPIAIDDGPFVTDEDTSIIINMADLLTNDVDVEGNSFTVTSAYDPDNGTVVLNGSTIVFTPRVDHFGNAGFHYTVTDSLGASSIGYASITVIPKFDLPIAVSDAGYVAYEDGFIDFDPAVLMANDIDPDGNGLTFVTFNSAVELANGMWRITPQANFFGELDLSYSITNQSGFIVSATVKLNVINTPDAPVAVDDVIDMVEDTPLAINITQLLSNDIEIDREAKIFTRVVSSTGVDVAEDGEGRLLLSTMANAAGYASFVYEMMDSTGLTSTATVSITIAGVNDAPLIGEVVPWTGVEDTPFSVTLNPSLFQDPDGDAVLPGLRSAGGGPLPSWLTFSLQTLTISGTPPANFNGELALELTADDGRIVTVRPVSFVIAAVNDAPTIGTLPVVQVAEDEPVSFVLDAALFEDVDGDTLTVSVLGSNGNALPAWLVFDGATRTLSGTPPLNYDGIVNLQVVVTDGTIVTVKPWSLSLTAVNDAPVVDVLPVLNSPEDAPVQVVLPESLFTDVDGDVLVVNVSAAEGLPLPAWLSFDSTSRTLSGTPPANFNGIISLQVSVSDGTLTTVAPWQLNITAVNDAPVISPVPTATATEDTAFSVLLDSSLFSDVDEDTLTVNVLGAGGASLPAWLSFDAASGRLSGTPPQNFNGNVMLQVQLSDGSQTVTAPWVVAVNAVNDAPIVLGEDLNAGRQTEIIVPLSQLLANDSDVDGDVLTVVNVSGGDGYLATLDGNGNLVVVRERAISGVLPVTYVVSDGTSFVTAILNISVVPDNDAPIIGVVSALHGAEDNEIDVVLPAAAFSDPNGDALTYVVSRAGGTALPAWLTFDAQTLRLTGTPPANFNGTIALQVVASDGALSTTRAFDLVIDPVNDIPVLAAPLSNRFVMEDQAFSIALQNELASDPDGDALSYSLLLADGSALPGWMSFNATTLIINGTPPANYFGSTQLRLFISDGVGTISDDFTFTVSNANDAPVVATPLPDVARTTGTAFTVSMPQNAFIDPDGDALQFAAQLSNGQALPTWLSFNGTAFTGTAPTAGTWNIRVLATDGTLQVSDEFVLSITGASSSPIAVSDGVFTIRSGVPAEILASQLLLNDTDPNGDNLTVIEVRAAQHGTVSLANGIVTYKSATGYTGADQFIYKVSDGVNTAEALVAISVTAAPGGSQTGGNGVDLLFGGNGTDYLNGGNGSDILSGGNGADILFGGAGADLLSGDNGNDNLYGGDGSDILLGGNGNDFIAGGKGNDLLTGGSGADTFLFRQGDGLDIVLDYRANQGDRIHIDMFGVNNFDDLLARAQQTSGGVLFAFASGDELFLAGTQLASLDRNSFTFY